MMLMSKRLGSRMWDAVLVDVDLAEEGIVEGGRVESGMECERRGLGEDDEGSWDCGMGR